MTTVSPFSRQTLEETPSRVLTFLRAVGTSNVIRTVLTQRGYTADDHAEGWELLHRVSGYREAKTMPAEDGNVQRAIAELDAWDEPNFRWIRAALARRFPEQAAFVFDGLEATTGAGAVLSVKTLLDRLDALESAPDRKASRKKDHAGLELLARRTLTKEERKRLHALVETAQAITTDEVSPAPDKDTIDDKRSADLVSLKAWFDDWAETARVTITRRDHLIRLGLAKRKKVAKSAAPEPGVS